MTGSLGSSPQEPKSPELGNAHIILTGAYDTASHFLELFRSVRKGKGRGAPTDREQDLLRAMLVFACAGLDSMLKQAIRDALESVIERNPKANANFKTFVTRELSKQDNPDSKLLSEILTSGNPRSMLIGHLVEDLTSRSLQSKDQVLRAASFFDISSIELIDDIDRLEKIFRSRNEISHEMDVDLKQPNRNRRPRSRDDMIAYTKEILQVAGKLLIVADERLA